MLHYYWFSMFCGMLYKGVTKGTTEDTQNDIRKSLKAKKK